MTRALISGVLWLALLAIAMLQGPDNNLALYGLLIGFILAIMLGKSIMATVANATGFSFFLSWYGLLIFYAILTVGAILIAPIYCIWNIFKFASTPDDE